MSTYYIPSSENLGDKIIWLGIKKKMGGNLLFDDGDILPTQDLVVCGTPWLWDQCFFSDKYRRMGKVLKLCCGKKIAIGIGSSYPFSWIKNKEDILIHNDEQIDALRDFWKQFYHIVVRDRLAKYIFDKIGVKCYLKPCPSFCVTKLLGIKSKVPEYDLLVIQDPGKSISGFTLPDIDYDKLFINIGKKSKNLKVIAIQDRDREYGERLGYNVQLIRDKNFYDTGIEAVKTLLDIISRAATVYSVRIHSAIPAVSLGKKTYIIPTDSRYLTAIMVGAKLHEDFQA